jgi:hypothetical protein
MSVLLAVKVSSKAMERRGIIRAVDSFLYLFLGPALVLLRSLWEWGDMTSDTVLAVKKTVKIMTMFQKNIVLLVPL